MNNRISNNYLLDKIAKADNKREVRKPAKRQGREFGDILNEIKSNNSDIKISKHAQARLQERNVTLSQDSLGKVSEAMDKASQKGIKDALILLDGNALVASIRNKTIVTCAKQENLDTKIITNIDGAIIL